MMVRYGGEGDGISSLIVAWPIGSTIYMEGCLPTLSWASAAQVARIKIPSALCNQHTYPHTYRVFLSDEKLDVSSLQIDFVCYSVSFTLCHLSPTLLINVTHGTQETPLATPPSNFLFYNVSQKKIYYPFKRKEAREFVAYKKGPFLSSSDSVQF